MEMASTGREVRKDAPARELPSVLQSVPLLLPLVANGRDAELLPSYERK